MSSTKNCFIDCGKEYPICECRKPIHDEGFIFWDNDEEEIIIG